MNFAIIAQQLVSGMGSSLMIFVLTLLFSMPLGLLVPYFFAQMLPLRCDYHRLFY